MTEPQETVETRGNDRVERVDHSVAVAAERTLQNQRRVVESVLWYLRHE